MAIQFPSRVRNDLQIPNAPGVGPGQLPAVPPHLINGINRINGVNRNPNNPPLAGRGRHVPNPLWRPQEPLPAETG